jgi:hypothetical protein
MIVSPADFPTCNKLKTSVNPLKLHYDYVGRSTWLQNGAKNIQPPSFDFIYSSSPFLVVVRVEKKMTIFFRCLTVCGLQKKYSDVDLHILLGLLV